MNSPSNSISRHGELPPGKRIYTFGDVHGRLDLLLKAKDVIRRDIAERPAQSVTVIGLGDVVDRGPDSAGAIGSLAEGFEGADETIVLLGNHEELMLSFIDGTDALADSWLTKGASATLLSFGLAPLPAPLNTDTNALRQRFREAVGEETLAYIRSWPRKTEIGGYFFSHAGARPGVPLDQQQDEDLTWFRNPDPQADPLFEKMVIHGHTPLSEPFMGSSRINLDTGAVFSGRLSLLALEGAERRLMPV